MLYIRTSRVTAAVISICLAAVVALAIPTAAWTAQAQAQHEKNIEYATKLLQNMRKQNDSEAMGDAIASCKGVAIFPKIIQAGLGIGGMGGDGVVLIRGKNGWTGPSFASLMGGSIGLQIGIKEVGLVLVITNEAGLQVFTGGQSFKLGGDVSIAAGPVGRDAEAATDSRAAASIYSYSMSKGLFAGLTLSGSTINVNGDANKAYWGKKTDAKAALAKSASDSKIKPLTAELDKLSKKK
ncbi:MAG: lipid-binding SYLF domain-containing protein [Synergistaceae bacterium]|jgi:lipid-binding SYLF domain-containing protein|nr:lipid-binding SYLF domain-containing protein [Synergistaceae bacterium]